MDRISKVLLTLIALGLWANVLIPILRPPIVSAQDENEHHLADIERSLTNIEHGVCVNSKICK